MAANPFDQFDTSYAKSSDLRSIASQPLADDPKVLKDLLAAYSGPQDRKLAPEEQKMVDDHIEELKRQLAARGQPVDNPFDKFDGQQVAAANPFDKFDNHTAKQGPSFMDDLKANIDKPSLLGIAAEGATNLVTGLGGAVAGPVLGGIQALRGKLAGNNYNSKDVDKMMGDAMDRLTYSPRTEEGQEVAGHVGDFVNNVMVPLAGHAGAFHTPDMSAHDIGAPPTKGGPKPTLKDIAPEDTGNSVVWDKRELTKDQIAKLEKKAPSNFQVNDPFRQLKEWQDAQQTLPTKDSGAFDTMADNLGGDRITPEARAKSDFAQSTLDNRQAAMEQEMKKRVTLEQGARDLSKPDAFKQAIEATDDHPMVQAAENRVNKASEALIKASEQDPSKVARLDRDLKALEDKADQTRVNVVKSQMDVKLAKDEIESLAQQVKEARDARRPFNVRGQGGAVNPEVFKEGFQKLKQLADGTWLRAFGDGQRLNVEAIKDSHQVGHVEFNPKYDMSLEKDHPDYHNQDLEADMVHVHPDHRGKGLSKEMYQFASELGNDVRKSGTLTENGKGMWDKFEQNGVSQNGRIKSPGNKQMGGLWMGEPKPRAKPTPEQIEAKQQSARVASMIPAKVRALDEFRDITSKEEALTLGKQAKDISKDYGQKRLGSGVNFQAIMSNHPFLKYLRHVSKEVRARANMFSEKYITHDQNGLASLWPKMSEAERVQTMKVLMEGDADKLQLSPEAMEKLGFTDTQKQFVKTFREADDAMHKRLNEQRAKMGLDPIEYRTGHFPGIFSGSYKSLVLDGKDKVVGVITGDTAAQVKLAKQHMMDHYDDVKFTDLQRSSLQGSNKRYYSDVFSGMNDVLHMLSQNDPRFAEVQEIINNAMRESNNKLFNFDVHQLQKKGVVGNAGNKPWLSDKQNAKEAFQALVRYFEEGTMHHEMQVPLQSLREMMQDPSAQAHPNALAYMDKYIKKMTGDDVSPIGAAMNTIIDSPMNFIPNVSWSNGKFATGVGVGGHVPLRIAGAVKNNMSQYFMGWMNYMFTAAQLMQPIQTGTPFMQLVSGRLGLNPTHIAESMGKGGIHFNMYIAEKYLGKQMDIDPAMRAAARYAEDRGMMTFSEIENAYQGAQGELSRAKDKIAEINMKVGEYFTRAPMFMSFVDMLHNKGGIDLQSALPIAENLTQFAMIDYHQWERPMLWGNLGVMGQFAGGLTTFKHGYMSQEIKLAKEGLSPTHLVNASGEFSPAKRQLAPFIVSAILGTMIFQGITGTPFYGELDQAYGKIKEAMTGKYSSIREDFLKKLPEWLNTGALSNATGMNLQGKFSSADMIPDDIPTALSPQLTQFAKTIGDAIDYAKMGDHVRARNLVTDLTPQGWKGIPEYAMRTPQEKADGFPRNKEGLKVGEHPRSEEGWKMRAATGLRPQPEAVEREILWNNRKTDAHDTARRTEIEKEYVKRIEGGEKDNKPFLTLQQEYMTRGGDPTKLIELAKKAYIDMQLNEKQRLQGIPTNLPSINRYENYNR